MAEQRELFKAKAMRSPRQSLLTDARFEEPLRVANGLVETRHVLKKDAGRAAQSLFRFQEAGVPPAAVARYVRLGNFNAQSIRAHPAIGRAINRAATQRARQGLWLEARNLATALRNAHRSELNRLGRETNAEASAASRNNYLQLRGRILEAVGRKAGGIAEALDDYPSANIHDQIMRRLGEEKGFSQFLFYLGVQPHRIAAEPEAVIEEVRRGGRLGNDRLDRAILRFARQIRPSMDSWMEAMVRRGLRNRRI